MANIYLTDSDEEAIVDFVKDHTELYETSTLREADTIEVWMGPKGNGETSDLDTRQVRISEVVHQIQGAQQAVCLQITGPKSQCFSYYSTQHLQSL